MFFTSSDQLRCVNGEICCYVFFSCFVFFCAVLFTQAPFLFPNLSILISFLFLLSGFGKVKPWFDFETLFSLPFGNMLKFFCYMLLQVVVDNMCLLDEEFSLSAFWIFFSSNIFVILLCFLFNFLPLFYLLFKPHFLYFYYSL